MIPSAIARFAALLLVCAFPLRAATQDAPPVAAASDLKFALDEAIGLFHKETGRTVRPVYGSSGNFMRQIQQGAPFELFLSADEHFVFELSRRGLTVDDGVLYATGRIVLFAPNGSALRLEDGLEGLRRMIQEGSLRKFAIANPEHAPYGRAARESLEHARLWDALRPRLVLGENVSQAAQFSASGSVDGGIFALSLAISPGVAKAGRHVLLPENSHAPLRQRMVLTKRAGDTARAFYAWMGAPAGRAVLQRHGFALPGGG